MNQQQRTIRVGAAAVLCACVFRLGASGLPEKLLSWLSKPNTAAFLTYLETGRNVRFSASQEVFWVFPAESAVPQPEETVPEPEKPAFTGEDAALVELYNTSGKSPEPAELITRPLSWDLTGGEPTVLILHTHSTESYTKNGESYTETSAYRTLDEDYNMLSIGAYVAELLAGSGITAIQDRELHDYPSYNGSYVDARASIRAYLEEYPTIQLVLDLHRDAAGTTGNQLRTLASVDGQTSAQLMLVMGTNYDTWPDNLSLALKLHAQLEQQSEGIMRKLCLRPQRFNQDLCPGALLVEVGAAGNTHAEALLAAEQLAQAIISLAKGTGETPE
ncbi:MAG: stage II sporulation protein P [Oscillospiraceae bacterium]|nr:stage II sporulation protein P [Oscillospiraceae bacterium]MBQ8835860.1 stage II sporulation protein P [Oscillospiraceae bacterium]